MLEWVSLSLFVSNKRQNSKTDRAKILCDTSCESQGRFVDDQFFKNLSPSKFDFENFKNPRICFYKIRDIFCFC